METDITLTQAFASIALALLCLWIYKCIVRVREDQYKVVEGWSKRYIRTISGVKGKQAATEEDVVAGRAPQLGEIIDGEDNGAWDWIWYGLEFIATYKMRKIIHKQRTDLTARDLTNVAWGNPDTDSEVSVSVESISDHYREQYTYELRFDRLETGNEDTEDGKGQKITQNVKMSVLLNVTVVTTNPYRTMYKESDGGRWLIILHNVIMSCLSELFSKRSFNGISSLRGEKLDVVVLPDGKTACGRINEQMLDVKNLGQKTEDLDFLDFEVMDESKDFVKALAEQARAAVEKGTAADRAEAERLLLRPQVEAKKELVVAERDAFIKIRQTEDVTAIKQVEGLPRDLRTFAGNLHSPSEVKFNLELPSTGKIITEAFAREIANEIGDDNDSDKKKRRS
ncbi:MAG TPA: hypothetical protein VGE18_00740 [Candidatus Paceibacterota bacterium]